MPEVTWGDINDIIHRCKGSLQKAYKIEIAAKHLRKEIIEELDKLNQIVINKDL